MSWKAGWGLIRTAPESAELSPLCRKPDSMNEERDSSKESLRTSFKGGSVDLSPDASAALVSTQGGSGLNLQGPEWWPGFQGGIQFCNCACGRQRSLRFLLFSLTGSAELLPFSVGVCPNVSLQHFHVVK